jgi:23S rRNA pseudouridine1911/1915/1917 synthase
MLYRLQTKEEDVGVRLDTFLQRNIPELSKTTLRKIVDLGGVHLDGRRNRKNGRPLVAGLSVEVHYDQLPLDPYRIAPDQVVFQDRHLLVLNKPAGINTQPTPARYKGTLYEAVQVWLNRNPRFRRLEIGMSQRLDRDTSGVIVFSIHPQAHKGLSRQIQERSITKHYLALVSGCPVPAAGQYVSQLAKERRQSRMKSVPQGGREAITEYRVEQDFNGASLVAVQLKTGRTHQIRVHFAEAGHPLLGDQKYGGCLWSNGSPVTRHCLHASGLGLVHPVSGDPLSFTAELPSDMRRLCAEFHKKGVDLSMPP